MGIIFEIKATMQVYPHTYIVLYEHIFVLLSLTRHHDKQDEARWWLK